MAADIGVIGLGVMGRSLALNLAEHGFTVALYDLDAKRARAMVDGAGPLAARLVPAADLPGFARDLAKPAAVLVMVNAGPPVDQVLTGLIPVLTRGDVVIDGGNSHYPDTERRARRAADAGLSFVGVGISGGEAGARSGASLMAGGPAQAYARIEPMLTALAARVDGAPCAAWVGEGPAGHFVKMLHNGIEYAEMQAIADVYSLMETLAGLTPSGMAGHFARWNEGELQSYLVEITARILATDDPETGRPMVDVILDRAGQKGTGVWTISAAMELGVAVPTLAESVTARALSAAQGQRLAAADLLHGPKLPAPDAGLVEPLAAALYAARLATYAQGFAVLSAARAEHGWPTDLAAVARIWRGGCIIRARLLEDVMAAYGRNADLPNLLLDPAIAAVADARLPALRRVVGAATAAGLPVPALAAALGYLDGLRQKRGNANLIQAQRDFFGAHTFIRTDREGAVHFDWEG